MPISVTELIGYASHEGVDLGVNVLVEENGARRRRCRCDGVLRAQVDVIVLEANDHILGHGMLDADTNDRYPQYYALALWARLGDELLATDVGFAADTEAAA